MLDEHLYVGILAPGLLIGFRGGDEPGVLAAACIRIPLMCAARWSIGLLVVSLHGVECFSRRHLCLRLLH